MPNVCTEENKERSPRDYKECGSAEQATLKKKNATTKL